MEDTAKYLIHANVTADGVVERSDVVGAVFGQTEGLLGTEMDLRKLQEASKVGRIDVDVESERGSSFGTITIASSLGKVETAVLAAALETITRVGPCRSDVEVDRIEDVRAAKRRDVVDRAKELMSESFDGSMLSTQEILEEVRRSVRVEDITEYEGLPAGPHVGDSDAIILVEGRADVLQLLQYGIKNAVAVEGTDVPDVVGDLTQDRTVTAFFDGDRGGDLILKELAQIGDVDYVALAPPGRSVEELTRREVTESLREKMPYEVIAEGKGTFAATDGSVQPAPEEDPAGGPATPESAEEPATSHESPAHGTGETSAAHGVADEPETSGVDPDAPTDAVGDEAATAEPPQVDEHEPPGDAGPVDDTGSADDGETTGDAGATDEADAETRAVDPGDGSDTSNVSAEADDPTGAASTDDSADGSEVDEDSANESDADATEGTGDPAEAGDGSNADEGTGEPDGTGSAGVAAGGADVTGSQQIAAGQAATGAAVSVEAAEPSTLPDHVRDVIGAEGGSVRLLDESHGVLTEAPADEAFETIEEAGDAWAVVLDGELTQRVLDVAAQRGVSHVVARETGDFVKRPTSVRIRTADRLLEEAD